MKKVLYLTIVLLSFSYSQKLFAFQDFVPGLTAEPIDTTFKIDSKKLTDYLKHLYDNDKWMGGVAITKDGKIVYLKNFGKLGEESNRAADPGTKYRIGSITKMYTATIIYRMAENNVINLNDTLDEFFPKVSNSKKITIKQMLGHRSGIASYTDDKNFDFLIHYETEEIVEMIEGYDAVFSPGEEIKYSNSNYFLLGLIAEKVMKKPFNELLESLVLGRGKLMRTTYMNEVELNKNYAYSFYYDVDKEAWSQIPSWDINAPQAAGMISASASDVALFLDLLFNEQFISQKYLDIMTDFEDGVGYGSFTFPFYERWSYGHTGGIEGFQSIAQYFPEERMSVVLLSNGVNIVNNDVTIGILSIVFGRDFEIPDFSQKKSVPVSETDRFLGIYHNADLGMDIELTENSGKLFGQATGQSKFPLEAINDTEFQFDVAGIHIKFEQFEDGQFQQFTLFQAGTENVFERK